MFCTRHRWHISQALDTGRPLPRRVVRHLHRCPACAAFHQRCQADAALLAEQAQQDSPSMPAGLHAHILRHCTRGDAQARWHRSGAPVRGWGHRLTLAAALILLGLLTWRLLSGGPSQPPAPPTPPPTVASPGPEWPNANVVEAAATVDKAVRQPLAEELRLLTEDSKAAAGFVLACVPVEMPLQDDR